MTEGNKPRRITDKNGVILKVEDMILYRTRIYFITAIDARSGLLTVEGQNEVIKDVNPKQVKKEG